MQRTSRAKKKRRSGKPRAVNGLLGRVKYVLRSTRDIQMERANDRPTTEAEDAEIERLLLKLN